MGLLISRFRKQPTIKERLQTLVKDIKDIEEFQLYTQKRQKNLVGRFIIFSVIIFICAAVTFYFLYLPERTLEKILYIIPFVVFPFLITSLKRVISWYFSRKIKRDEVCLAKLKEEKKRLLDEVMDKETYKNAKEILEKFAPEQLQSAMSMVAKPNPVVRPVPSAPQPGGQELRRRTMVPLPTPQQPNLQQATPGWRALPPAATPATPFQHRPSLPSGPPLPRPVLPRERSVMDRLVEFIVGDGPSNRYALVCRQCASHNGMALQEEFEYLAFRCCYCFTWNPARKQRPQAPLLPTAASSQEEEDGESSPSTASSEAGEEEHDSEPAQTATDKSTDKVPEVTETEAPAVPTETREHTEAEKSTEQATVEQATVEQATAEQATVEQATAEQQQEES